MLKKSKVLREKITRFIFFKKNIEKISKINFFVELCSTERLSIGVFQAKHNF